MGLGGVESFDLRFDRGRYTVLNLKMPKGRMPIAE